MACGDTFGRDCAGLVHNLFSSFKIREARVSTRWKIIGVSALILAVFLVGFVPQFVSKRRLQNELEDIRDMLSTARFQIDIDQLRTLAGRMLLETSRQNYGIAATHSTEYFNKARELAGRADDQSLKLALWALLDARDSITSGLAQGNSAIIPELQSLLQRTYDLPNADTTPR